MNNNPYEGIANYLNQFKNKEYLGTMIAEVIEPLPNLKLKLLNGAMEIDYEIEGEQIFISQTLTNRIDIDITFKEFESQDNVLKSKDGVKLSYQNMKASSGQIMHPTPNNSPSGLPNTPLPPPITNFNLPIGNIDELSSKLETKGKGKMKAQFLVTLKKGDKVLIMTNETNDQFFIIDVMVPLKEVKDKWEYYQKS